MECAPLNDERNAPAILDEQPTMVSLETQCIHRMKKKQHRSNLGVSVCPMLGELFFFFLLRFSFRQDLLQRMPIGRDRSVPRLQTVIE